MMFVRIERPHADTAVSTAPADLVELISPRTNAASYTPIEHLFAALSRTHVQPGGGSADQFPTDRRSDRELEPCAVRRSA